MSRNRIQIGLHVICVQRDPTQSQGWEIPAIQKVLPSGFFSEGFTATAFAAVACSASQMALKHEAAGCLCSHSFHSWKTSFKHATGHKKAANCAVSPNPLQRMLHTIKPPGSWTGCLEAKHWNSPVLESQVGARRCFLQGRPEVKLLRTISIFSMRPGYLPHRKYHHLAALNPSFASSNNNFRGSIPRQSLK